MPQPPQVTAMLNGADLGINTSIGGITSVFGNYLAGPTPASLQIGDDGKVTNSLAGVQLLFSGIPAPLLYVSPGQMNAVIPYDTPIDRSKTIPLELDNASGQIVIDAPPIAECAPGLFNVVINSDGSINSASNPAPKGATVTVYGTGLGQTTPAGVDGTIVQGPPFPVPVGQFSVGPLATLTYIGPAPGFVSGVMQANIQWSDATLPGRSSFGIFSSCFVPLFNETVSIASSFVDFYILSDAPVISGIEPASPQIGSTSVLAIQGQNFNGPMTPEFFLNGTQVPPTEFDISSATTTSLSFFANFLPN